MSCYIMKVESTVKTFSIIETGDDIEYEVSGSISSLFKNLKNSDNILGYVDDSSRLLKYVFEITSINTSSINLKKNMEFSSGIDISLNHKTTLLKSHGLVSISLSEYEDYLNKLVMLNHTSTLTSLTTTDESVRIEGGSNILLYGVPGTGKSYKVSAEYCSDESKIERVVFGPDYFNAEFLGQISVDLTDADVNYIFSPGPFAILLKKAYEDPGNKYYLVIEEINRGKAFAIFGEAFQLLDRVKSENTGLKIGTSEYSISNQNVARYVYGNSETKIRIPSNMWIIATMNTSDQNVFNLDNAFQRRWDMIMVENSFEGCAFAETNICGASFTWKQFCVYINDIILDSNMQMSSSEDKRLGVYFIDETVLHDCDKFSQKVLKYLWDDAFKFNRDMIFETSKYNCLEKVIIAFRTVGFEVLKDDIVNKIVEI